MGTVIIIVIIAVVGWQIWKKWKEDKEFKEGIERKMINEYIEDIKKKREAENSDLPVPSVDEVRETLRKNGVKLH